MKRGHTISADQSYSAFTNAVFHLATRRLDEPLFCDRKTGQE